MEIKYKISYDSNEKYTYMIKTKNIYIYTHIYTYYIIVEYYSHNLCFY